MLVKSRLTGYYGKSDFHFQMKGRRGLPARRQRAELNKQSRLLVMACDIFV